MRPAVGIFMLLAGSACSLPEPVAYAPNRENAICSVIRVVDGDTIDVICKSGGQALVRIVGFDTPETFAPGCAAEAEKGERAKERLTEILSGATLVGLEARGADKYRRMLARVTVDGQDVADLMVAEGLAVRYKGGRRINWCERLMAA